LGRNDAKAAVEKTIVTFARLPHAVNVLVQDCDINSAANGASPSVLKTPDNHPGLN
jgi:hypothetical protein